MSHEVVGVDVQQTVVDKVNAGTEPFPGEAHLQEKLSVLVPAGKLRATCDYSEAILGRIRPCGNHLLRSMRQTVLRAIQTQLHILIDLAGACVGFLLVRALCARSQKGRRASCGRQ